MHNIFLPLSLRRNQSVSPLCLFIRLISGDIWNEEFNITVKKKIESHWRDEVNKRKFNYDDEKKEKYYVLSMFPYPSGNLHMGHVRVYTISDTLARYYQMKGKNVFQPMGWDAFGLPAENAAIERKIPADEWTINNIKSMKTQLNSLGSSFDWSAEVATCKPDYYRWTQYIFLKLFHSGLVYQKDALVNWDPVDKTVLADEQVDENGISWRSGAEVEKKVLKQWFIKTTYFAKSLYDGLKEENLRNWDDILDMQRNWIGECNGLSFDFEVVTKDNQVLPNKSVRVWTQNPEHLNKVQFLCVMPGCMLDFCEAPQGQNRRLSIQAKNPINGSIIPIFVSNSVAYGENQDVKAGLPEIFEEDCVFAREHGIETRQFSSIFLSKEEICNYALEKNIGGYPVSAKLRDWLISRQRYWGTPIPIIHCNSCGPQPVPYDQLPVSLPPLKSLNLNSDFISPLESIEDWVNTSCPNCGGPAKRETDTLDTFVDSSWYFLRYTDNLNHEVPFSPKKAKRLLPVDIYIGGKEHAVLHLYYARFMNHFFHSIGWVENQEPFHHLLVQGMIRGQTFRLKKSGKYVLKNEVTQKGKNYFLTDTKEPVLMSWDKMSKSKHNGVEPQQVLEEYGIDTTRLLILDQMAPASPKNWRPQDFRGILNWQAKVWLTMKEFLKFRSEPFEIVDKSVLEKDDKNMWHNRNLFVKSSSFSYGSAFSFHLIISKMYILSTSLRRCSKEAIMASPQYERSFADMIICLSPIAPHFGAQLWTGLCSLPYKLNTPDVYDWTKSVFEQKWPEVDEDFPLKLICKVNNAVKEEFSIPKSELNLYTREKAIDLAMSSKSVQQTLMLSSKITETNYFFNKNYDHIVQFITNINEMKKNEVGNAE